jgi:hypothetical protein
MELVEFWLHPAQNWISISSLSHEHSVAISVSLNFLNHSAHCLCLEENDDWIPNLKLFLQFVELEMFLCQHLESPCLGIDFLLFDFSPSGK